MSYEDNKINADDLNPLEYQIGVDNSDSVDVSKFYFTAPDTGIYSSDGTDLNFTAGGVESFRIDPKHTIEFTKEGKTVGELSWVDGELKITGDLDESAKIFFDSFLKSIVDGYLKDRLKRVKKVEEYFRGDLND